MRWFTGIITVVLTTISSTVADANVTATPTQVGEGIIRPGIDQPLGLFTPAPKHGFAVAQGAAGGPPLTIHVHNNGGVQGLHVGWRRNAGFPANLNGVHDAPFGSSTMGVYPTGWAGRIAIGFHANSVQDGSSIEADFQNGKATVDVTYVVGYSVPITCSANSQVVTGCDTPLLWSGIPCPNYANGICYNPDRDSTLPIGAAAQAFFEPCRGAAAAYPNDVSETSQWSGFVNEIFCCVGHNCPRNPHQHNKRSLSGPSKRRAEGASGSPGAKAD